MKQKLIQTIQNNRLKPDDTFQFHCTQCGKCCINREDILLNAKDIFSIARKLKITPKELINEYGEAYIGQSSRMPVVRLKPIGNDNRCPFLDGDGKKCSIHSVKPVICAMFPIGRASIFGKDGSAEKADVEYFFTDPGCGDSSESHTLRDWLAGFDIPLEDDFFIAWQQTIAGLCNASIALEKLLDTKSMHLFWNKIMFLLYLNYDTGKDFLPQFRMNMDKLKKLAGIASTIPGDPDKDEGKTTVAKTNSRPVQWNERIAFECQECGECCRHIRASVPVDSKDIFRLAQYLKGREATMESMDKIVHKFAEPILLDECGYYVYALKTTGPDDACVFLKENRCTVQEAKPLACRTYPFFAEPNDAGSFDYHLSLERPHHFSGNRVRTRDWMKRNFTMEDRAFVNEDVANTEEIAMLLQSIPEDKKAEAVAYFLQLRYFEYDLDQSFLEQFKQNNRLLLAHLRKLAQ